MDTFHKQIYEEFEITGDFSNVMTTDETLEAASDVEACDKDDADAAAEILGATDIQAQSIKVIVKSGTEIKSPYKITFKAVTSSGNKWELDVKMALKEI